MHIFGKKKEKSQELVELTTEEQQQVDQFINQMQSNFQKYLGAAESYNAKMLGQWFSLREFNRITNHPLEQCRVIINEFCDYFFLLMDEKPGSEVKFKFITKPEERLPYVKTAMQQLTMSFISKRGFLGLIEKELSGQLSTTATASTIEKPN